MTGPAALRQFLEGDVRNWSVALEFWAAHTRLDLSACTALEVGSRHGGLSLWLATRGATVVCTDVQGPTERARRKHAAAGVAGRISYECLDARRIPWDGRFDLVVFKSVLGAVGREGGRAAQARAVAQMHKALRAGGELFFAENLVASPVHRFLRRRFVGWSASWRYVSIDEMRAFVAGAQGLAVHVTLLPPVSTARRSLEKICHLAAYA